ncbi:MAG: TonB-dependent receptor [Acidobacteria bacterium]|nr:TonB-dependent receptor [Acidobacteriota bacterium]
MRLLFALFASSLMAQLTDGTLSGRVLDPMLLPVQNAEVEVLDRDRGVKRVYTTNSAGAWLAQIPPASYQVTVSKEGFKPGVFTGITVEVASTRNIETRLQLAALSDRADVISQLQVDPTDSGTVIARSRIASLPLNRRGFLQLSLLTPGASPPVQDSELSLRGTFATNANGAREEFNNFLLDGVDNNDLYTNRYVLEPAVDAIQEFKITTGSYSAEYGRGGGAQVNVITRGGANQLHGAAYEYFRNRALDAANYFDSATKNKYARNQFGGLVSGPVIQNRTFFFLNADALTERRGLTRLATVPTNSQRAGDLSALTATILDPFTRQPFAGKQIPASRINRMAANVLSLYPAANQPGLAGNFLAQPVLTDNYGQGGGRLDHHLRADGVLSLRYLYSKQDLAEPYLRDASDAPGFGDVVKNAGHNVMAHYEQPINARLMNSFRIGLNRSTRSALPQNHGVDAGAKWNAPWLNSIHPRDQGYPFFNIQGLSSVGDGTALPLIRYTSTTQLLEDISWMRGRHLVKAGFQLRNTRANGNVDLLARGSISLSGVVSGSGISDLLLGFPSFALQAKLDNTQTLRTTSYNAYLQDEWRITPSFAITLGLRYEYNTPATDPFDRMAVYDAVAKQVKRVGTGGVSRSGIQSDRNNFAPRAGFAWNARRNTVIRGGYGLYYDSGMLVTVSSYYFNPPFFTLRAFFPTATSLITLDNPFPATGGISPVSPSTLSPDLTTSYVQHWSFQVQQQVCAATTFTVGYAGSAGAHLIRSRDINQARPGSTDLPSRRPAPAFGGVVYIESAGNSNYHALQASLDRRLARRVSLLAAYTWAKSIDDTSAFLSTRADKNFPQDSYNFHAERAPSSFDLTQRVSASLVASLPEKVELRAITVMQGGMPFTPLLRFDNSNTGNTGGNFGSDRPNVVGDPHLDNRTPARWFNTSALVVPARYTFGNAGRNIVRGPAYATLDAAVARPFRLTERLTLTLEAQAFNLTSRANFDLPERNVDDPLTFGKIFSAKPSRQAQFALRLSF